MSGVYEWVDEFRFSRSKRNTARDFSDAVLMAELIAQLFPAWVELHNYPSTHRIQQKLSNWETLNRKVLTRIKCEISKKQQEDLANAVPGAIEVLLLQVRKQTAKTDLQKATFKTSLSPMAEPKSGSDAASTGLKVPHAYSFDGCAAVVNAKQRYAVYIRENAAFDVLFYLADSVILAGKKMLSPYDKKRLVSPKESKGKSLQSPRESNANSSLGTKQSDSFSASEILSTSPVGLDEDKIAASLSKILQLMSRKEEEEAGLGGIQPLIPAIDAKRAETSPKSILRALTPDHKQIHQPTPTTRARSASADSKSRLLQQRTEKSDELSPRKADTQVEKVQQVCKPGRAYKAVYGEDQSKAEAATQQHGAKNECAESSFVYFSCDEKPPAKNELHAWTRNERVQVARVVRNMASGDCLVQLFKTDTPDRHDSTSSKSFKVYVSTPHFVECCGSQLHNIQNMAFDTLSGTWKWYHSKNEGMPTIWKRDLEIAIVPSTFKVRDGPKSEPSLKSRALDSYSIAKKSSQNSNFFTEVLSRVKCNSISLDEPVVVCATEHLETETTRCPAFDTMFDAILFETPVAPTVFPKVQVEVAMSIPQKPTIRSPKSRKSNASNPNESTAQKL